METTTVLLQVSLLGDFRILYKGEQLATLHQARAQSLLAYLLLHRDRAHKRQRLAFLFWPDSSEQQAHSNLRKTLHLLRSALPSSDLFLHADANVVQWQPTAPFVLDVALFEQLLAQAEESQDRAGAIAGLEKAVELYQEDLLPSCYDDWIAPERERLRERFLDALRRLSDSWEQERNASRAIRCATRLLRSDPLHEETYRRLMRLHLSNGDRAAALGVYHTCVSTLQRELGVAPSPPTQAAYSRLMQMEVASGPPTARSGKRERLIGRHEEWQRLSLAWQHAAGGQAHFVCVAGDPGIGKTRLIREFAQWAEHQGYAATYARAYAAEGRLAYDPVAEWLRSETLRRRAGKLEDRWLMEVARIVPELVLGHNSVGAPEPAVESWQRRQFFEGLSRAFCALPEPLLLVLDDLQWCDPDTLEWLHYLLRRDPHARLLIVGATRPGEVDRDHPLQVLLRQLRQSQQLTEFELAPFDNRETSQLAQQLTDLILSAEQLAELQRVTEGNPLLIHETIRAEMERGRPLAGTSALDPVGRFLTPSQPPLSTKLQAVIESRLAQLSSVAYELATLAAVSGRTFTVALLRHAGNVAEESLVTALDELWQRRIVREQGSDSYDFSHDKIREVAYAGLSPARRRHLHQQVARALEQLHAPAPNLVSARIAAHYWQAGEAAKAAAYYLQAAQSMQFGLAFADTLSYLRTGIAALHDLARTTEKVALEIAMQLALGRLLSTRDGWGSPGAVAAFAQARQLCLEAHHLELLAQAQDYLLIGYADSGRVDAALTLAENNVALAEQLNDSSAIEGAHGGLGLILWCAGDLAAARVHLERAAVLAAAAAAAQGDPDRALQYPGIFPNVLVYWLLGYPDTAGDCLRDAMMAQERQSAPFMRMTNYEFCVMFYYLCREWRTMLAYARKMLGVAQEYDYVTYVWLGEIYVIAAAAGLHEPHAGSASVRQNIKAVMDRGIRMWVPYALCLLAEVCASENRYTQGIAALDEALALAAETGESLWLAEIQRLRGLLLAATGATAEAETAYALALTTAQGQQAKMLELRAALGLGRLWQAQGRSRDIPNLLAPIVSWFTQGFATDDLQAARELLAACIVD